MQRHAPVDADAHRANLGRSTPIHRPNPDGVRIGMGRNAPFRKQRNHGGFQRVDIASHRKAMVGQSNDWIGDKLAGSVKSDVSPAIALDDLDALRTKLLGRGDEISVYAGPTAIGDEGRMLDEINDLFAARPARLQCVFS